jgi:hypothetical protein
LLLKYGLSHFTCLKSFAFVFILEIFNFAWGGARWRCLVRHCATLLGEALPYTVWWGTALRRLMRHCATPFGGEALRYADWLWDTALHRLVRHCATPFGEALPYTVWRGTALRRLLRNCATPFDEALRYAVWWGTALRLLARHCAMPFGEALRYAVSFRSHYGPGFDSASNRNEYQEYTLGVKASGAYGWQPYHLHASIVSKSGNLNTYPRTLGACYRPPHWSLYLFLGITLFL